MTGRRDVSGFWAVAFALLIVMAFATLPSPLYGLYRTWDGLSAFMTTVVFAIFAVGAIATLLGVSSLAARAGRRGVMLAAVVTMMAAGLLAAWKDLPGLLVGRLFTGVAVGLGAGVAIPYLIESRLRADPKASMVRARNIGTAVNVGALGSVRWSPAAWARGRLGLLGRQRVRARLRPAACSAVRARPLQRLLLRRDAAFCIGAPAESVGDGARTAARSTSTARSPGRWRGGPSRPESISLSPSGCASPTGSSSRSSSLRNRQVPADRARLR